MSPRWLGVFRVRRSEEGDIIAQRRRVLGLRRLRLEQLEERVLLSTISLATDYLAVNLESSNGTVTRVADPATGNNYLQAAAPLARLRIGATWYSCSSCTLTDNLLTVAFASSPQGNVLTVEVQQAPIESDYFVFTVTSLSPLADELRLFNFQTTLKSQANNFSCIATNYDFAIYIRSFSPAGVTYVNSFIDDIAPAGQIVGAAVALGGSAYGSEGAAVRAQLKTLIAREGLLTSSLGGPWALDASATLNQESYIFADNLSETNVQAWIALARSAGIGIIHINGWAASYGHYGISASKFPNGLAGMKSVVDQIHAAGLKAGLHTLTACITTNDSYVTPTPDPRLGKDVSFTMAADITDSDTTIYVNEAISGLQTTWGANGGNVLMLDSELIQYTGYSTSAPYAFTGCTRGVFGTTKAAHSATNVSHLYSNYGYLCPDPDTTLHDEIGVNLATTINTCGFDLVYLDGAETNFTAYGRSRGKAAIFSRIDHPVRIEASMWDAYSWTYHSVVGAWDYPTWGDKGYIDSHAASSLAYKNAALLPAQLGWWGIRASGTDYTASFPDELEYLCAKALATGVSLSFEEVSTSAKNGRQAECLDLLSKWQTISIDADLQARLGVAGDEFHLETLPDGSLHVVQVDYAKHKLTGLADGTQSWTVSNTFGSQSPSLRIEALYGVGSYDAGTLSLTGTAADVAATTVTRATGVTASLTWSTAQARPGEAGSMLFTATNSGTTSTGAWAKAAEVYASPLSMAGNDAIGVWIFGDGLGEILNLQLFNAAGYHSALSDHYVTVDFTGWRYFEFPLRERDVDKYFDYTWPYAFSSAVWRFPIDRSHVGGINIYYNNLPAGGATVNCYVSLVKPLPIQKITLTNPTLSIGGATVTFPTSLQSGQYLEVDASGAGRVYDQNGFLIGSVTPSGVLPLLAQGNNTLSFTCSATEGYNARANVMLGSYDRQSTRWDATTLGAWGFEESSDQATADDASPYLNNGRFSTSAPTRVAGKYGNALQFNGVDASVAIPASQSLGQLTGSFTAQLWFECLGASQTAGTLVAKNATASAGNDPLRLYVAGDDHHLAASVGNGSVAWVLDSGVAVADGAYHHAALVYDDAAKTYTLYLDGQARATQAVTADWTIAHNADGVTLGCWAGGNYFRGILDEVQLVSRPLTAAEIALQFLNQPPTAEIVSPAGGDTFLAPTSITICARVDDDGSIRRAAFYRGTTWIADGVSAGDGTYWATWADVPESAFGTHALTVRVADDQGALRISAAVQVTIVAGPALLAAVENQAADPGQPATFFVSATGSGPLTYQWQLDGVDIPGATGDSYTTAATTSADDGRQYRVVVANPYGTLTSNTATLGVNYGLTAWWKLDETAGATATDSSGNGYNGQLMFGAARTAGVLGGGVALDGLDDYVSVPSTAALKYLGGEFSLSAWVFVNSTETTGGYLISKAWNGSGQYNYSLYLDSSKRLRFTLVGTGSVQKAITASTAISTGAWHYVAATVDTSNWMRLYVDGSLATSAAHTITSWTPSLGDANRPLAVGTLYPYTSWSGNTAYSFDGRIDSVRIYAHTLSSAAVAKQARLPTVTAAAIGLSGATGDGGVYRSGDTATVAWNDTSAGDANPDIVAVTVDFSQFGGASAVPATNTAGLWTASFTLAPDTVEATGCGVWLTVTSNVGNYTTAADDAQAAIDTFLPVASVLSPANNATAVPVDANLVITFREDVRVGTGQVRLRAADGSLVETVNMGGDRVTISGSHVVIDPAATLDELTGYYVEVEAAALVDMAGNAFAGFSGSDAWNFTTAAIANLDVDGNGSADALTDGILILRYLFDPSGAWNYADALGAGATRTDRGAIKSYLDGGVAGLLDVDGNGRPDALTDGILILRYLFDRQGAWDYSDALGSSALRTSREAIRNHLDPYNPNLAASLAAADILVPTVLCGSAPDATLRVDATDVEHRETSVPTQSVATRDIILVPTAPRGNAPDATTPADVPLTLRDSAIDAALQEWPAWLRRGLGRRSQIDPAGDEDDAWPFAPAQSNRTARHGLATSPVQTSG